MISAVLAVALIAKSVHFEVPASGYKFDAAEGGVSSDEATQETRFIFRGHAVGASKEMEFRADTIKGLFSTPKSAKKAVLKHAETTGKGTVTRTAKDGESTVLQGSKFVFDGDASVGHLKVAGPVQITDGGNGKSNLHMTGNNGSAEFDVRQEAAKDALKGATLDGNVVVDVAQFGKSGGSMHVTGDHMVLDNSVSPHTLVLTGNVSMRGVGKTATGFASGFQKVKFLLNRQGQFTHVSAGESPN